MTLASPVRPACRALRASLSTSNCTCIQGQRAFIATRTSCETRDETAAGELDPGAAGTDRHRVSRSFPCAQSPPTYFAEHLMLVISTVSRPRR